MSEQNYTEINNNNNNDNSNNNKNNNNNINNNNNDNGTNPTDILHEDKSFINNNELLDAVGDIHANKYYNKTRNHNLSMTSAITDLSNLAKMDQHKSSIGSTFTTTTTNTTTTARTGFTDDKLNRHISTDTNKIIWDNDDFSDKRTIMTDDTQNNIV